jgi:hypothetical protein
MANGQSYVHAAWHQVKGSPNARNQTRHPRDIYHQNSSIETTSSQWVKSSRNKCTFLSPLSISSSPHSARGCHVLHFPASSEQHAGWWRERSPAAARADSSGGGASSHGWHAPSLPRRPARSACGEGVPCSGLPGRASYLRGMREATLAGAVAQAP